MQKRVGNRLAILLLCLLLSSFGIGLILYNLNDNIMFFYPPSQISSAHPDKEFRVGGLVVPGSIKKLGANKIEFTIKDEVANLIVIYEGVIPALFRGNQGVVATGKLNDNLFIARELLIKHDENYSPSIPQKL